MPKLVERELQAHCHALQKGPDDLARIPRGDLARMLLLLYLVREFETAVLDLKDRDLVHGPAHTSVGQEAIAAATADAAQERHGGIDAPGARALFVQGGHLLCA